MIRRYLAMLRAALMASDALSAMGLLGVLLEVRFRLIDPSARWDAPIDPAVFAAAYGVGWVVCLWLAGLYRLRARLTHRAESLGILRAAAVAALVMLSLLFAFKLDDVSRLFLVLLLAAQPLLTIASRFALLELLRWLRRRGYATRQMLIVGANHEARELAAEVSRQLDLGIAVAGHLAGPHDDPLSLGRPVLGTIDQIVDVLHARVIDEVAICLSPQDWSYVEPITRLCEEEGRIVRIATGSLGSMDAALTGGVHEQLGNTPLITFLYGPNRLLGLAIKRFLDLAISSLSLVALSPLLVAIALYVRVADGSPILFRQVRVGLHGRPFVCMKFRTMVRDAEERYDEVAHLNKMRGPAFKIDDDPRISRVGRLLRRSGLDELPQLINVLRGEMSIVGPRPAPPREVAGYSIWHRRRLMMRPGMTGYWQVEARADDDFDRRARLDLAYIDRWSLWMDIKIVLRTIPAMLAGDGR